MGALGWGEGIPPQDFGRSVNQGRGADYALQITNNPRFTDLPTALQPTNHLYKLMDWCENCVW